MCNLTLAGRVILSCEYELMHACTLLNRDAAGVMINDMCTLVHACTYFLSQSNFDGILSCICSLIHFSFHKPVFVIPM